MTTMTSKILKTVFPNASPEMQPFLFLHIDTLMTKTPTGVK